MQWYVSIISTSIKLGEKTPSKPPEHISSFHRISTVTLNTSFHLLSYNPKLRKPGKIEERFVNQGLHQNHRWTESVNAHPSTLPQTC